MSNFQQCSSKRSFFRLHAQILFLFLVFHTLHSGDTRLINSQSPSSVHIVTLDDNDTVPTERSNSVNDADRMARLKYNRILPIRNNGNRTPVILVPGDGGSQFEARFNKPETLHYFCEKTSDWFDLWLNLELMVPYILDCWVDNMKLVYNNVTRTTTNSPGVEIRIPGFGNTTRVEFLDPSRIGPIKNVGKYFTTIVELLVSLGYERGISVRGAPYDFRKAPNELGDFYIKLKQLIEETYTINNNQPVMLICHSMGCPNSLYLLNRQTQEWKDQYIKSLVTLASPWGGAVKAMKVFTSGDNLGTHIDFNIFKLLIGDNLGVTLINSLTVRTEQRSSPSTAFLMPSNRFWPETEDIIISPVKNYSLSNLHDFFHDVNWPEGYEMWLDNKDAIYNLSPPGVEVHCLYGVGVDTMEKVIYTDPLFPDEANPRIISGDGDGTVNVRSLEGCFQWKLSQPQNTFHQSFNGSDHMQLLHDSRVIDYIRNLVN